MSFPSTFSIYTFVSNANKMITKDIINETYIRRIVARDAGIIYDTQADVIADYLSVRTGRLRISVAHRYFDVANTNFTFKVLNYLRFLDIKYRKRMTTERANLALYNRVIYGVLYRETLPDIKYGLTQDMKESIAAELETAGQPLEIQ